MQRFLEYLAWVSIRWKAERLPTISGHSDLSLSNEAKCLSSSFVADPPPTIVRPVNASVVPGDDALLECVAFSSVEFNITWWRYDATREHLVQFSTERAFVFANGSLFIRCGTDSEIEVYTDPYIQYSDKITLLIF